MKAYWNGKIVNENEIVLSPWDLGLLRGYGVFDYISVYNKKPFRQKSHLDRLESSARMIDLEISTSKTELMEVIENLVRANGVVNGAVRIVVTGGISPDGISKGINPTILIRTEDPGRLSDELYKNGASLITAEYERELPLAKTIHYIEALRHEGRAKRSGASEVLFVKNGNISECSRSNIFIVSDGLLLTPNENVLLGITRKAVLEIANELNIPSEERDVSITELMGATEVFITGTGKKILPIVNIDDQIISSGLPGEITKKLITTYESRTRQ